MGLTSVTYNVALSLLGNNGKAKPAKPAAGERHSVGEATADQVELSGAAGAPLDAQKTSLYPEEAADPDARIGTDIGAVPGTPDVIQTDVIDILKLLNTAKLNLAKKVEDVKKKADEEIKAQEKKELKKKVEQRQQRVADLQRKIERLAFLPPESRGKIGGMMQNLRAQAQKLQTLTASLNEPNANVDAVMVDIDAVTDEMEQTMNAIDKELRNNAYLTTLFGQSWTDYARPGALDDGAVTENELTDAGKKEFQRIGASALDGLTEQEVRALAQAKRIFALSMGTDPASIPGNISRAFDEMVELAAQGKLTQDSLNDIFKKYGIDIHLNGDSFAALFTGGPDKVFGEEKVASVQELAGRLHNIQITLSLATGMQPELWDNWDSLPQDQKERYQKAYVETFRDYAASKNFFIINAKTNRGLIMDIFRHRIKDGSRLKPQDLLARLAEQAGPYQKEFQDILDRNGLTIRKKWDQVLVIFLSKVIVKCKAPLDAKTQEEVGRERMKGFEKMIVEVQESQNGDPVRMAYMKEFSEVILDNRRSGFDWERVLDSDQIGAAPAGR